jgi:phosphomannomutase
LGAPAIVVTGSHIPFDRNGIKFYRADGEISKADEQAMLAALVDVPDAVVNAALPVPDGGATAAYVQRYLDYFGAGALAGARVAVYEHSSVGRDVLRTLLQALGAEVTSLGRTETFVPIDTEAVRPEDVAQARLWATEHRFDALLSTDGDADRPLIGDERGEWLRGDLVGILCAQALQAQVVVTPVSSNTAVELCGAFGQVLRTRIGSPYVIAGMDEALAQQKSLSGKASGPVVGYEANGGFLLGSDVLQDGRSLKALPTRDAVLPMLALLVLARKRGCKLSALSADLPKRFTASDRLQAFATDKSRALLLRLQGDAVALAHTLAPDSGAVVATNQTDGLRVTFANGDIVHLRPSGNAPELRCYAEADSAERAKLLCDGCLARVAAN